jgi:hypothetical protein
MLGSSREGVEQDFLKNMPLALRAEILVSSDRVDGEISR